MIYITRRERFNAAHRMFNEKWSSEKNDEVFGKCANPNWHGHTYELFVTVKGEINQETGYLMNLKALSKVINENIIDKVDHKNLNLDVDFMKSKIASTENLVVAVWKELAPLVKGIGVELHCVKIKETENNIVEYYG